MPIRRAPLAVCGAADLVLLALQQFGDSRNGMVGLNDSLAPDGIRYTGSNLSP